MIPKRLSIQHAILVLLFLCVSVSAGAEESLDDFHRNALDPEYIQALIFEGNYGRISLDGYDVSGYDLIPTEERAFGTYPAWDFSIQRPVRSFSLQKQYSLGKPYFSRMGFVQRHNLYSPDDWGRTLRDNNILYLDPMGGSRILESLMLCKKYGLTHYFYAPDYYNHPAATNNFTGTIDWNDYDLANPIRLPFFKSEFAEYAEAFRKELQHLVRFYKGFSTMYEEHGGLWDPNWREDPERLYLLFVGGDGMPIDGFLKAVERDWNRTNAEFRAEYGFDLPMYSNVDTPKKIAQRIAFWHWARGIAAKTAEVRVQVFKEAFAGKGRVSTNVHFSTQVDYERYGEIFDPPGVAIRPAISSNPLVWRYYNAYGTKLVYDLTDQMPVISVRCNQLAVGSRIIPTPETIRYWYSETIKSGCQGFYHFPHEGTPGEGGYRGLFYGNPDRSTLPKLRWETTLEMTKLLGETGAFVPPASRIGVLVSLDHTNMGDWKRIMSAYIELREAGIWFTFISDQEMWEQSESLENFDIVFIPVMTFEHQSVLNQIEEYVQKGGTVVACDPDIFSYDEHGESVTSQRRRLFGVSHPPADFPNIKQPFQPGRVNAVTNTYGTGKTYFCKDPIMNIYSSGTVEDLEHLDNRSHWYRERIQEAGAESQNWVYDVNVLNVRQLTGEVLPDKPPILHDIEFRDYHVNR